MILHFPPQQNLGHIVDPVSTSAIISYSSRIEMLNKAVFAVASTYSLLVLGYWCFKLRNLIVV